MADLKPCPFCGGQAELRASQSGDKIYIVATCLDWDCLGHQMNSREEPAAKARERWNRRAAAPRQKP